MIPNTSLPLFVRLMDELPVGVVLLDRDGRVVHYNQAEERLAGRSRDRTLGREFFVDVAPCMNVQEMAGRFFDGIGRTPLAAKVEFSFPFPQLDRPRDVLVELRSFEFDGAPFGCLFVEDVSAQRAIDRMKDNLSQMLVHDLKNPLQVILSNIGFIESRQALHPPDEAVSEALSDTSLAATRLNTMLLTLLDVSRLETQTMPLRPSIVDLRTIAGDVARGCEALARVRGIALSVDLPASAVEAFVDAELVRRALDNLVENSIRYARRSVQVGISRLDDGSAGVRVVDDGPGVPAALREAVFEKHVQVQDGSERRDNRGLGLTFVRMVARGHGGEATCSCPAGGGSLCTMVFPPQSRDPA